MGAGHVIGDGGVTATAGRLGVAGDALALVESLDGPVGDAHVDQLADQPVGNRVPAAVDLDVVVGRDAAALPDGEGIRSGWQGFSAGASTVVNARRGSRRRRA